MKGLIYKDFITLLNVYKKNLLLVAVVYGGLAVFMNNDFFLYFGIWMMGFYGLTGFSLDIQCGWDRYARTLPISDEKIITAKFIANLLFMAMGIVYGIAASILRCVINGSPLQEVRDMLMAVWVVAAVALMSISVIYFLAVKFGPDKARNYFLTLFLVLFFCVFLLGKTGIFNNLPMEALQNTGLWLDQHAVLSALGLLALSVIVLLASIAASCAVYRRKDF